MAFLSDTDILAILSPSSQGSFKESEKGGGWQDAEHRLLIHPFNNELLTPVGYDCTVGTYFLSSSRKRMYEIGPGEEIQIFPGETVLIATQEYIGMPKNRTLGGLVQSKVSIVSRGLSHVSTTIDNDWEGHLLIALTNHQDHIVTLKYGQSFCTVMFLESKSPATRSCGKVPGRKDITEERLRYWLEQMQKEKGRSYLIHKLGPPALLFVMSILGYVWWGPTEGFSAMVALGATLSTMWISLKRA